MTSVSTRPADALRALLLAACLAPVAAQQVTTLTTPDGSHFVLAVDPTVAQLHWAVASHTNGSDDPIGFVGLSRVALQQSMLGTYRTGSRDAAAERLVQQQLDEAWQRVIQRPGDAEAAARVQQLDRDASQAFDPQVFPRVLAALPSHAPTIVDRGAIGVFVLTTLPSAIEAVGAMLVERREDIALRELPRAWLADLLQRAARTGDDPFAPLRTEVLALALPTHPLTRQADRTSLAAPTHREALATWAATQHPTRTVHVLLGDFDAEAASEVLRRTFATTALPPPPPLPPPPRPFAGIRRSNVPGTKHPMVLAAWPLPEGVDRTVLAVAAQWLAGGADSRLASLLATGERRAEIAVRAPWPPSLDGRSLLVVEVSIDGGVGEFGDGVLEACRTAAASPPNDVALQPLLLELQQQWRDTCNEPRQQAIAMAAEALAWPGQPALPAWPERVDTRAVQALLQTVLSGPVVLVEGRP